MRAKKDRNSSSASLLLTPSTEIKVGESFIVLRRGLSNEGVADERCVATIVEVREREEDAFYSDDAPVAKVCFFYSAKCDCG